MISNAKDSQSIVSAKDNNNVSSLPYVAIALHNWMQLMTFNLICKRMIDGYTQEIKSEITTHAVRQPMSPQLVNMQPAGQRSWKWETLHALPDLVMNIDDQVTYQEETFRVKGKKHYPEYGYIEYQLAQDYNYMNEAPEYDS
ncbi:MAG: hypothetical protein JRJ39_00260 [Deltaproteobacteria bacterium]|nr:hypothetical protein [Deltaproteobacteria bacterium]